MSSRKEQMLRRRRKRRRRRARAVAVLPSLFTLGNLIAGFAAIYYASKPNITISPGSHVPIIGSHDYTTLQMAGFLIFLGMFFDAIDGYVARLTRSASDIGAQLDSLADIVTFGVAPAYMTLQLVSKYYLGDSGAFIIGPGQDDIFGRFFWLAAAVYVCCTALRLARFNVETAAPQMEDHLFFRGLPSPGAAGCIASLILLHQAHLASSGTEYAWAAKVTGIGMAFILVLCAWGMVSRLPYVHFMNKYIRGHASFGYIVKLAIILAFASFFPVQALAIGFTAYALSAPSRYVLRLWQRGGLTMRGSSRRGKG